MRIGIVTILILLPLISISQKLRLSESNIRFFSEAPLENIEAINTQASGLFSTSDGKLAVIVPIRGFEFDKSLMQEHFNEKYLESDKYPRAIYTATINGFDPDIITQEATSTGDLTIHGVTRKYKVTGSIKKSGDQYIFEAVFPVELKDHKITIPKLMWSNIAEVIEVTVNLTFVQQ